MVGLGLSSLRTRLKFYDICRFKSKTGPNIPCKREKTLRHRRLMTLVGARVSIAFFHIDAAIAPCFQC